LGLIIFGELFAQRGDKFHLPIFYRAALIDQYQNNSIMA